MRDQFAAGDEVFDFVGLLGLLQHIGPGHGHVVLVGGGLGVAPVFRSCAFKLAGNRTTCIVGFRDASRAASGWTSWLSGLTS